MALFLSGCTTGTSPEPSVDAAREATTQTLAPAEMSELQQQQQAVALAARDALFQQLLQRLTEVLTESGPSRAIQVCKSDAPRLASEVGEQFGVVMGRTSHRLRNPNNAPRDWAKPLVDAQVADPQFVDLDDGRLGALLPIRLKTPCLLCHGPRDEIVPDVKAALVSHYPEDQATGFQEGDLRGWFWIEVPADIKQPEAEPATSPAID